MLCKRVGQGNDLEETFNIQPFKVTESVLVWHVLSSHRLGFCPAAGGNVSAALA